MATEELEPTIYELRGDDGVQVTYATRYPQGPGWLLYAGPQGRHAFSPGEIDVRDTELGREVTVTLKADDDAVNLTVLIPPVHLDSERAAPFETLGFADRMGNRQRTSTRNGILKAEAVLREAAILEDESIATRHCPDVWR